MIRALILLFTSFFVLSASGEEKAPRPTGALPSIGTGFAASEAAKGFDAVCATVFVERGTDIDLGDMETRLVCGDPAGDPIGVAWSRIPPNQAAYFFRGFLQSRGHHQPTFVQDGSLLFVQPGPVSRLEKFTILGGPANWSPPRLRLVNGRPLVPGLLDELESWSVAQLKADSFACATARSEANPETGEAIVYVAPGEAKKFARVVDAADFGLREGVLNRYNAFRIGDTYNEALVKLTKTRTERDGFLETLLFTSKCEKEGVVLTRDVVLGPSRTIRLGVGGSTDEGARFRAIIRRNRIGSSASSAQARVNLSYLDTQINRQVIDGNFRWYYSRGEARSYFQPTIVFERVAQQAYETQSVVASIMHGWRYEYPRGSLDVLVGPNWENSFLSRGEAATRASLVFGEITSSWLHHDMEIFVTSPRTGERLEGSLLFSSPELGADVPVQRLQVSGQKLWNVARFDPPLLILGTRFNLSSTFTSGDVAPRNLPIRFFTFLGGERDLRGFAPQSLPRSRIGALSGATGSLEARLHRIILRQVDLFSFVDAGLLGGANFELLWPVFVSPGFGVRWESPFGTLRTYLARRFAVEERSDEPPYPGEWRLGFTFGEEF